MAVCIAGWSHTKFGRQDAEDVESLIRKVSIDAVHSAGLDPNEIDSIVVGHFNSGFSAQDFAAPLVLQADPAFRFRPSMRVENACATGSAAVHQGVRQLQAKSARAVLVVGVEKMTALSASDVARALQNASYRKEEGDIPGGFAGVFSQIARDYFARWGDQSEAMARIAAKNHRNGMSNPYAHMRKDLGVEACNTVSESNPMIVWPLRRTDCSMVSDGAAAVVLMNEDDCSEAASTVRFRGIAQATDFLPMSVRDMTRFEAGEVAWKRGLESAGLTLSDLDFVETHDCFTIAELIEYETMGLTAPGEGKRAILEGWVEKDGRFPVNPSGGLKAKGHPVGATGVSMHVMLAMQLTGKAGDMQLPKANLAGIFNMGGAAVSNYVTILERSR